jgi:tetratricopeptide (TPR) repeat protein
MSAHPISFRAHEVRTGSIDGGRVDFQQMIAQLIRTTTPSVRSVAANPGDWGIDAFVGSLANEIVVWQSKYFINGVGPAQQKQIRESFTSLIATAANQGFIVRRWVLCIPVSMDGPMTKWWDAWKKRQEKANNIEIGLWDETELVSLLLRPGADAVRVHYYSIELSPAEAESGLAIQQYTRIYISTTSGALQSYRKAAVEVCQRLGMTPINIEDFDPQRPRSIELSREEVERCDAFVLLLGGTYGPRPIGEEMSYSELEYLCAISRQKLPVLAFLVDPAPEWLLPDIDSGIDSNSLARFVDKVKSSRKVKHFSDPVAFRQDLIPALRQNDLLALRLEGSKGEGREPQTHIRRPKPPVFYAVTPYVGSAPFIGRNEDLARLDDWGRSGDPMMVVEAIGGAGKSALTWKWVRDRAPTIIDGLAGRLWWSFYDGTASLTRFLEELLAYTTGQPLSEIQMLEWADLTREALASLRSRPYLVVLDGFERLLATDDQFRPFNLGDETAEQVKRSLTESAAYEIVRGLTTVGPSKILISSRPMTTAFIGRFGKRLPGVACLKLPGLTDADTRTLLNHLGVYGNSSAIGRFFGQLGNHPLLVGIVAGLVLDYRAEPGGFDRWLSDPTAGAALHISHLELSERHTHILKASLDGLRQEPRRLLGWISVLPGAISWETMTAINPFVPEPNLSIKPDSSTLGLSPFPATLFGYTPASPTSADDRSGRPGISRNAGRNAAGGRSHHREKASGAPRPRSERDTQEQGVSKQATEHVEALLDGALKDLVDRGLLWWDRSSNSYDLHPIIRAYARDQLEETDRIQANDRIRDHFQALPPEDPARATSVEDLNQTITIFRALVGANHLSDACRLWANIGNVLLVDLGAYATIIELLGPLAINGSFKVRTDLSIAYNLLGSYEEAIAQDIAILESHLQREDPYPVYTTVSRVSSHLQATGELAAGTRCIELLAAIAELLITLQTADSQEVDGDLHNRRGVQAALQGRVEDARRLFDEAEQLGVLANPWFEEEIEYWRLYLALVNDQPLTLDQITAAIGLVRSARIRLALTELRCEVLAREGKFEQALISVREHEQLGHNAGLDLVPARRAFLLTKVGRHDEAAIVVDETLSSLPSIHPARRPHYHLARALWELGRRSDAVTHARDAYRQAWADGPPHSHHWNLQDARGLLKDMSEPIPRLPIVDLASVDVPLENEVLTFISALECEDRSHLQ